MALFVLRRVLWTIPILLVVVTATFFLVRASGGDPFRAGPIVGVGHPGRSKVNDRPTDEIRSNLERKYGLDLPWHEQYLNYLHGLVTFDLGPSLLLRQRSVNDIIREQAPISLQLGALAVAWIVVLGVPAGVLSALFARRRLDTGVRFATAVAIACRTSSSRRC
jgi:oligopeptide transport system permease protein